MTVDRRTLNLIAAILCGIGSLAALLPTVLVRGPRDGATRAALLSGLFGTIGSAAWAVSAYQDVVEARADTVTT